MHPPQLQNLPTIAQTDVSQEHILARLEAYCHHQEILSEYLCNQERLPLVANQAQGFQLQFLTNIHRNEQECQFHRDLQPTKPRARL